MKWLYRMLGIAALLATLAALVAILVRSGPSAPIPPTDPAKRLNAEHANLVGNAAPYYEEAVAALRGRMPQSLVLARIPYEPEMRRLASEWVAANDAALDWALRGTREPVCWIDLSSDWTTAVIGPRMSQRELAKLIAAKAWLAIAQHDTATALQLTLAVDALGRHFASLPTLVDQIVAFAIRDLAQELVFAPITLDLVGAGGLAAYAAAVEPCFQPSMDLHTAFATEADIAAWAYASGIGGTSNFWLRTVVPPARFNGEYRRRLKPILSLLQQPMDAWTDPENLCVVEARSLATARPSPWNVGAMLGQIMGGPHLNILQLAARWTASQRGNWTALQVLAYIDTHGEPPRLLDELPPGERLIDPFSGRPFAYRADNGSFILYSLGFDRDDDGGCHDAWWGQPQRSVPTNVPSDGDYVFWPRPE